MTTSREHNLTDKEIKMLAAFVEDNCPDHSYEQLLEDNFTWMNANDLQKFLGWDKQAIGGVMASLLEKNLIEDSGESSRGASVNDFALSEDGIRAHFGRVK